MTCKILKYPLNICVVSYSDLWVVCWDWNLVLYPAYYMCWFHVLFAHKLDKMQANNDCLVWRLQYANGWAQVSLREELSVGLPSLYIFKVVTQVTHYSNSLHFFLKFCIYEFDVWNQIYQSMLHLWVWCLELVLSINVGWFAIRTIDRVFLDFVCVLIGFC